MPDTDTQAPPAARFARGAKVIIVGILLVWLSLIFWNSAKPLPPGTLVISQTSRLSESDVDISFASAGHAAATPDLAAIDRAEQMIVLDRSPVSGELAQRLLARKRTRPNLKIVLVTDPANEAFGGTPANLLSSLEQAGVIVARVRLDRLRDSNPLYSGVWRLAFSWWSDPFEEAPGSASVAAWARMLNFKAVHRQLVLADDGAGGWVGTIESAYASAGLTLRGSLVQAMIASELLIAAWSTDADRLPANPPMPARGVGSIDARFLTEGGIESALLDAIAIAGHGDRIEIAAANLSDRALIAAALGAANRGARVQVLLVRNELPNAVVAAELMHGGGHIEVRWYPLEKAAPVPGLLAVRHDKDAWIILGAANFTRRGLTDLNLEASVEMRMPARAAPARAVGDYFEQAWSAAAEDASFANGAAAAYWRYRITEAAGRSNF